MLTLIDNFFSKEELAALKAITVFTPLNIGGTHLYMHRLPAALIEKKLNSKVICTFLRKNSFDLDNKFRIHSDGEMLGEQPTRALVVYITGDSDSSGTAFFSHPTHGTHSLNKVFRTDDGLWKEDEIISFKENTAVIYEANRFHSRHPFKSKSERIVLVAFLK